MPFIPDPPDPLICVVATIALFLWWLVTLWLRKK